MPPVMFASCPGGNCVGGGRMSVDRRRACRAMMYGKFALVSIHWLFHGRRTGVIVPRRDVGAGRVRLRFWRQTAWRDGGFVFESVPANVSIVDLRRIVKWLCAHAGMRAAARRTTSAAKRPAGLRNAVRLCATRSERSTQLPQPIAMPAQDRKLPSDMTYPVLWPAFSLPTPGAFGTFASTADTSGPLTVSVDL